MDMDPIVGIDLGTTNSAIAIMQGESVKVIPNSYGNNTTPSVVAYTSKGILIGKSAKNQAILNPTKTISSVKRLMGRRVSELPDAAKKVSYALVGCPIDPVQILIDKEILLPQDISALILKDLKNSAESYLKEPVKEAVITVPAYFNDAQRQATKKAGELAGFNVRRIINEPTAAALAYGLKENMDIEKKIVVFDLGGGTFDISILEIGKGVWEVIATNGDTYLGGDDFDREITNLLLKNYHNKYNIDIRKHPSALQKLKDAAEQAKCELSTSLETVVSLNFSNEGLENESFLEFTLTRNKFETTIEKYLKKIEHCCKQALLDAKLKIGDIDDVIMVGAPTRTPVIQSLAEKIFNKKPNTSVNPDEVVAMGAAIQGAVLAGQKSNMILVDVTPLSLGLETENELMDVLIPRNTPIPCVKKDIFTTTDNNQQEVDVYIFQGENHKVTKNRLLGQFVLDGIEPAPEGDPQIEVKFVIDADGILNVSAKNLGTGSEQHITIKDSSSATEEQKNDDSDDEDEEDLDLNSEMTLTELVEVAESLLRDTKTSLEDLTDVLDKETVEKIIKTKESLAEALDAADIDKIDQGVDELLELWNSIEAGLEE